MKVVLVTTIAVAAILSAADSQQVTFNRDVLPILQKHCQTRHRPGQAAPMSFLTFQEVRPWAKAMKVAVAARKMPPWFADSNYGHFLNDKSLTQSDIDTIAHWADSGVAEGMPHMHVRGKDLTYTLIYPDDRKGIVLSVSYYDFNWQLGYSTSVRVPKGTRLHVEAHYDNFAGKPGA